MTREEREAAIAYIKTYRKLDEDLHNNAPKDSVSYYATDKCLKYWDMAIQALSQEPITTTNNDEPITIIYPTIVCDDAVSRDAVLEKAVYTETEEGWCGYTVDVNYIKSLPSVTQKPIECDDAVSREAVINIVKLRWDYYKNCIEAIEKLPPAPHKSGKWIELPKALNLNENPCKCSECGHILSFMNYYPKSNYCPNCGAKMESEE